MGVKSRGVTKVTCSEIDSRCERLDFQKSISVAGNGSRPSSSGCAESRFNTSRI